MDNSSSQLVIKLDSNITVHLTSGIKVRSSGYGKSESGVYLFNVYQVEGVSTVITPDSKEEVYWFPNHMIEAIVFGVKSGEIMQHQEQMQTNSVNPVG